MVLKNIAIFLFVLASVAYIIELTDTPLTNYSNFLNVTKTSSGLAPGFTGTGFMLSILTTIGISILGASLLGGLIGTGFISQFTVVTAIALFFLQNLLPIPYKIFTDPSIPFPAQLILGGTISLLVIYAVLELWSGRNT